MGHGDNRIERESAPLSVDDGERHRMSALGSHFAAVPLRANEVPTTSEQLDMFATPIISVNRPEITLDERFALFMRLNEHVYRAFVAIAREYLASTGRNRVGAKAVFEAMRWRFAVRSRGQSDFALNNSYVSRMARLAAASEADLRDAFEFRALRSRAA